MHVGAPVCAYHNNNLHSESQSSPLLMETLTCPIVDYLSFHFHYPLTASLIRLFIL